MAVSKEEHAMVVRAQSAINAALANFGDLDLPAFLQQVFLCPPNSEIPKKIALAMFWSIHWPVSSLEQPEITYLAQLVAENNLPLRQVRSHSQLWQELFLMANGANIVTTKTIHNDIPEGEPLEKHQLASETILCVGETRIRVVELHCISLGDVPELDLENWEFFASSGRVVRTLEISYL